MKRRYRDLRKNMKALKQANITFAQVANLRKSAGVWRQITVNLREIEGSWPRALKTYARLFAGVPGKQERDMNINQDLLAPCGLYCGVCGILMADRDDNQKFKERLATVYGVKPEEIQCRGCLHEDEQAVFFYCRTCPIKSCTREKGISGCHQCDTFPCHLIDDFPMPVGRKVMLRAVPQWREWGTGKWVAEETKRYHCCHCGYALFRGAKRCRQCRQPVDQD